MRLISPRIGLALVSLAVVATTTAKAGPIVAGATSLPGTAIMDLTILGHTVLNPGAAITIDGLSGVGTVTLNRDAQVGSTINVPNLSGGQYFGSIPGLGSYVFGNYPPLNGNDFSGSITNVVQNAADPGYAAGLPSSFQSGDFSFSGASFDFHFLTGPLAGVTVFTDPFSFSAHFDGLPPSNGTTLVNSGNDVLNAYYNGVLVAQSSNRTIVLSTPEPATLLGLGVGTVCLLGYARSRKPRADRS